MSQMHHIAIAIRRGVVRPRHRVAICLSLLSCLFHVLRVEHRGPSLLDADVLRLAFAVLADVFEAVRGEARKRCFGECRFEMLPEANVVHRQAFTAPVDTVLDTVKGNHLRRPCQEGHLRVMWDVYPWLDVSRRHGLLHARQWIPWARAFVDCFWHHAERINEIFKLVSSSHSLHDNGSSILQGPASFASHPLCPSSSRGRCRCLGSTLVSWKGGIIVDVA
mmetsp:Transcript_58295/g.106611  ORF Transcript_58295/g.106611 Transcript_58295/m.106611 type:complete len:221 (-) Transcript_58295:98-760(-)